MKTRVLIADDHELYRIGLKNLLADDYEVEEAASGDDVVDKALARPPQVVVMDIAMPGMSGIEATKVIRSQLPELGILILSATDSDDDVLASIQAGASGYIVKDEHPNTLIEAVRNVEEGRGYFPPFIAKRLIDGITGAVSLQQQNLQPGRSLLTPREVAVLRLMVKGKSHREMADELRCSPRSIANHISSIYDKLHICDRAQAIVYAIKTGIVRT